MKSIVRAAILAAVVSLPVAAIEVAAQPTPQSDTGGTPPGQGGSSSGSSSSQSSGGSQPGQTPAQVPQAPPKVVQQYQNPKIVIFEHTPGDRGYWQTQAVLSAVPDPKNPGKTVPDYAPMDPKHADIRQRMMARGVLEEYADFLSPLRMPRTLRLIASDCHGSRNDNAYYDNDILRKWMNLCYIFMDQMGSIADYLAKNQAKMQLPTAVTAEQLRAGMFASVLMHETGHALFDLLDVPVFGREEDAADQVAGLVALEFGRDTARTVIKGFAYLWKFEAMQKTDPGAMDPKDPNFPKDPDQACYVDSFCGFSDTHGTSSQRMYNALCLAYGGQPTWFQDFVDSKWLPIERQKDCKREYNQAYAAFKRTIFPFIDPVQMAVVKKRQWFLPAELKDK